MRSLVAASVSIGGTAMVFGLLLAMNTRHLDQAIFAGKTDDMLFVYLAQAQWGLQDAETTLRMIRNAEEQGERSPALQLVRVQALWKLGRLHDVWRVLHHTRWRSRASRSSLA